MRLSIGQFALASQLSMKALRLYHRQGLLEPAQVDPETGYRYYATTQLQPARRIRLMRQMEMPMALIKQILAVEVDDVSAAESMIREYVHTFSERAKLVRASSQDLLNYLDHQEKIAMFQIEIKQRQPQIIASISKNVKVDQLDDHIRQGVKQIQTATQEQQIEILGAPFGIYHGPVTESDDGPMEVCFPINGAMIPKDDIVVRKLDGGSSASTTIYGRDCYYPTLLKAYDAVCDWINTNGHQLQGSPREIWHHQPGDEEKLEIVWLYAEVSNDE